MNLLLAASENFMIILGVAIFLLILICIFLYEKPTCPHCLQVVNKGATRCHHCHEWFRTLMPPGKKPDEEGRKFKDTRKYDKKGGKL
ncbi:uncharacterized protein METZ01_LOCUS482570 [marine metagenome]|uniref:Uncharacterized protein n=1 Tax=marine metagenome TaxID=408172 RepID=A0A383CBF3_9ZZZZ